MRIGLGHNAHREGGTTGEGSVAKLLFDAFSKRVAAVEDGLRSLSIEIYRLKISRDQSQLSDLVLLERIQRMQEVLEESLSWIKRVADSTYEWSRKAGAPSSAKDVLVDPVIAHSVPFTRVPVQRVMVPSGEASSLPSITTPTELQVLTLLAEEGPKSAPEIGKSIGRSREHSARLMKRLFEEGYVRRDQARIPFRYSLVERVRAGFKKAETKDEGQETVMAPQT